MPYVIDLPEYSNFIHSGVVSTKITQHWLDCVSTLPPKLKKEAEAKSFQIVSHPLLEVANTRYSQNLAFKIVDATKNLQEHLLAPENAIICLNDY